MPSSATSPHDTPPEEQAQSIQFPLHVEKSKGKSWLEKHPQWVVPAVADCIGAAQPFDSKEREDHPLWFLHRLVKHDKHRTLHVVVHRGEVTFGENSATLRYLTDQAVPLREGAVVAARTVRCPGGTQPVLLTFDGMAGCIGYFAVPGRRAVNLGLVELMEALARKVESILVDLRAAGG